MYVKAWEHLLETKICAEAKKLFYFWWRLLFGAEVSKILFFEVVFVSIERRCFLMLFQSVVLTL